MNPRPLSPRVLLVGSGAGLALIALLSAVSSPSRPVLSLLLAGEAVVLALGLAVVSARVARAQKAAARRSEGKFQGLLEAVPDAILLTDRTGRIVLVNQHAVRLFGYTREALVGQLLEKLLPSPDQTASDGTLVEEGTVTVAEMALAQPVYRMRTAAGELLDVEFHCSPLRESSEILVVNVLRDISEQRRRERRRAVRLAVRQLLLGEECLDRVAPALVRVIGERLGWDRVTLWLEGEGASPRRVADWCSGSGQRADAQEHVNIPIESGETRYGALQCHASGRCLNEALRETMEAVANLLGHFIERQRDRESLKRAEEQFRQSQKMEAIGRLSGGIAHDFNNLLTVLQMSCALLFREQDLTATARGLVVQIEKVTQRAAELTRRLLAFSRKQVLEPKVVQLNAVVVGMKEMLERVLGEDIDLLTVLPGNLHLVRVDRGQMEQVLMNLAVNARDAMPRGGKLTIEMANVMLDESHLGADAGLPPGQYVRLAVSDTGSGMSAEVKERLFEPFFTTKELGKGTGLGLSTVYGIVRQSGGQITVYSELDRGTTFKVYLPVAEGPVPAEAPSTGDREAVPGDETILLVEDDDAVRQATRMILSRNGYQVIEARDGREGLGRWEEHSEKIDLVITDVVMPRLDGPGLVKQLCDRMPTLKFLFLSGYPGGAVSHQELIDPDAAFLPKPFTQRELTDKVREVLGCGHGVCQ